MNENRNLMMAAEPVNALQTAPQPFTLNDIKTLTKDSLRSGALIEVLQEAFYEDYKVRGLAFFTDLKTALVDRAEELTCKQSVKALATEIRKRWDAKIKEERHAQANTPVDLRRMTTCTLPVGDNGQPLTKPFRCDGYEVKDDGVYAISLDPNRAPTLILDTPLIIRQVMHNRESGQIKAIIAWRDARGHWCDRIVKMSDLMDAGQLVKMSDAGLAISSVRRVEVEAYIDTFRRLNKAAIPEVESTDKMGWTGSGTERFTPFDDAVKYDGSDDWRPKFNALSSVKGSSEAWMDEIRIQRKLRRNLLMIPMAAALAAPLVALLGLNSFILDIYGGSHDAKSVLMMLVASMIGDPTIGSGIVGDFKCTYAAIEALADMLGNVPMFLDDSKSANSKLALELEDLIYQICGNKGRSRSNVKQTNERERFWRLTAITTGEMPLAERCHGGGAIGRVFGVPTNGKVFCTDRDGNKLDEAGANLEAHRIAEFARANHGHFFRRWIQTIKAIGKDEIAKTYEIYTRNIAAIAGNATKQAASLAIILTADHIASQMLFKDGLEIDIKAACELLADETEIDDNWRTYRALQDEFVANPHRFAGSESTGAPADAQTRCDQLGVEAVRDPGFVNFFPAALKRQIEGYGLSFKNFVAWCNRQGLLLTQGGSEKRLQRKTSINGKPADVYTIKMFDPEEKKQEAAVVQKERELRELAAAVDKSGIDVKTAIALIDAFVRSGLDVNTVINKLLTRQGSLQLEQPMSPSEWRHDTE